MSQKYPITISSWTLGDQCTFEERVAAAKAAVGGIGMLLWQGVAAFKLFTGKEMPAQEGLEKFFS